MEINKSHIKWIGILFVIIFCISLIMNIFNSKVKFAVYPVCTDSDSYYFELQRNGNLLVKKG